MTSACIRHFLIKKSQQITIFATAKNTFFAAIACVLSCATLIFYSSKIEALSGVKILDTKFCYTAEQAYTEHLDKYNDVAIAIYTKSIYVDCIYPLAYGLFFAFCISFFTKNTRFYYLNLLPFLAVIFDYFENFSILILLHHESKLFALACFASFVGAVKWIAVFGALLVVLIGVLSKILHKIPSA